MLELLINPKRAERKPWEMLFVGFFYSSVAIFISSWIFQGTAGMAIIFLTVLACIFLVHGAIKLEEQKGMDIPEEKVLLKEHGKALSFFMMLFFGFVLSFSIWYIVLPPATIQNIFSLQMNTINDVRSLSGNLAVSSTFGIILLNNLKVLMFTVLFAFFYGAGAIFVLAWNASIVGVAIGNFVRSAISEIAAKTGNVAVSHYFSAYSIAFLSYFTHGIIEILAYFVAALGAGIISIAIIKHDYGSKNFNHVLKDSLSLLSLSLGLLVVAAAVEVYITPLLF